MLDASPVPSCGHFTEQQHSEMMHGFQTCTIACFRKLSFAAKPSPYESGYQRLRGASRQPVPSKYCLRDLGSRFRFT
jgi:hypothetical protein